MRDQTHKASSVLSPFILYKKNLKPQTAKQIVSYSPYLSLSFLLQPHCPYFLLQPVAICNCCLMFNVNWLNLKWEMAQIFECTPPITYPNDCFGIFSAFLSPSFFSGLEHSQTSFTLMYIFLLSYCKTFFLLKYFFKYLLKYFCLILYLIFAIFQEFLLLSIFSFLKQFWVYSVILFFFNFYFIF